MCVQEQHVPTQFDLPVSCSSWECIHRKTGLVSSPCKNNHSRECQDYPYITLEVTSWTWRMMLFVCFVRMIGRTGG